MNKQAYRSIKKYYTWSSATIALQILIITIISTIASIGITFFMLVNNADSLQNIDYTSFVSNTMKYQIPIAAVSYLTANTVVTIFCLKKTKVAKIRDMIVKPQMSVSMIILAALATLGVSSVDSLIMNVFSSLFSSTSDSLNNTFETSVTSDNLIITVISLAYICVLGPIMEEVICRGASLALSSHVSPAFGVFASALLFGLMHGNIAQLYNAFMLGLLLGYVTLKSHSLIPAMIMHITNNSTAMITMAIEMNMSEESAASFDTISSIALAVIGIASLVVLLIKNGKIDKNKDFLPINNRVPDEILAELPSGKGALTAKPFFTCWTFWIVFGYCALASAMVAFGFGGF